MRRFLTGFAVAWVIDKLAWTAALSNKDMGTSILNGWVGRLSHDRFLNLKAAVDAESDRRIETL